jgi:hypothetical protein
MNRAINDIVNGSWENDRGASSASCAAFCGSCCHFRNDPAAIEAAFAGLTSLSSAFGSVRADDGICERHGRYLSARACCRDYAPAADVAAEPA